MADLIKSVDLAQFLNLTVKAADDKELDFLGKLCAGVTAKINRYTGQLWSGAAAVTDTLDGKGTRTLFLKTIPVNSITSVKEDTATLDPTTYYFDGAIGVVYRRYGLWINLPQIYVIAYNAGTATVPDDIKEAAYLWAAEHYQYIREKRMGLGGKSFGGQNIVYFDDGAMPKRVKGILDGYRSPLRYY